MLFTCFFHQKNSFTISPPSLFIIVRKKMKAVEMLGVCWGLATSAGVHGTCKCSAHELYHLPDFACH